MAKISKKYPNGKFPITTTVGQLIDALMDVDFKTKVYVDGKDGLATFAVVTYDADGPKAPAFIVFQAE